MEKKEDILKIYCKVLGIDDILINTIFTFKLKSMNLEAQFQEILM
jgi:hypothetical protein